MNILVVLIPASLILGGIALAAFLWMLRANQYEDPEGQANRMLSDRYDDGPAMDSGPRPRREQNGESAKSHASIGRPGRKEVDAPP